jgi:hypothetical protein
LAGERHEEDVRDVRRSRRSDAHFRPWERFGRAPLMGLGRCGMRAIKAGGLAVRL